MNQKKLDNLPRGKISLKEILAEQESELELKNETESFKGILKAVKKAETWKKEQKQRTLIRPMTTRR